MSTDAAVQNTVPPTEAAPAPVQLKPKNTNRLNRIFRKPKSSVAPRPWRVVLVDEDDEEAAGHSFGSKGNSRAFNGVSLKAVRAMVEALTESEKQRAAAGQDPLSATQEELLRRAERFGVLVAPPGTAAVGAVVASPEELRAREARFGPTPAQQMDADMQRRLARFGAAPAASAAPAQPVQLSEEDKAAMEARARRFAS